MLDKEWAAIVAELFNQMTVKQKNAVPDDVAEKISRFMVRLGYRLVFNKWYLQEKPTN